MYKVPEDYIEYTESFFEKIGRMRNYKAKPISQVRAARMGWICAIDWYDGLMSSFGSAEAAAQAAEQSFAKYARTLGLLEPGEPMLPEDEDSGEDPDSEYLIVE